MCSVAKFVLRSGNSHDYKRIIQRELGTWALSRLSTVSAGRVQPVLDIDYVIKNKHLYEESIAKRNLEPKPDINKLPSLYNEALTLRDVRDNAQRIREENTLEVAKIIRERKLDKDNSTEVQELKEKGKELRDQLRAAIADFNQVNDKIIDLVISLPNILDPSTPATENKFLKNVPVSKDAKRTWAVPTDLEWTTIPGVGPSAEFPRHKASLLELELAGEAQAHLLENKFTETGNVDFVQNSLFDVSGMDPSQFIRIREPNVNPVAEYHASYLVGGASFPAFLALFAQSLVKNPDEVMPIKYFVIGRSYGKKKFENVLYQRSAVQVFIACRTQEEMQKEFENLTNVTEDFLSRKIGTSFSMELVSAPKLQNYEQKQIAFLSQDGDVEKRKKTISYVSTIGDHVSKRLLCSYAGSSTKQAKFMHLITGRFLNLTDFIRPAERPITRNINKESSATSHHHSYIIDSDKSQSPPPGASL